MLHPTKKPNPDLLINLDDEETSRAEPMTRPEPGLNANLRLTLEQMRREADGEIARLNRKLAEREHAAQETAVTATERLALEQELETLQRTLGHKEQTLEKITDECRRLEDQLEDRNLAFDGLRQEVERKESSLRSAQDEVTRLQKQLQEVREHSMEFAQASEAFGLPLPPIEPDQPTKAVQPMISFSAGLLSGLVLLAVIGLAIWGGIEIDWGGLFGGRPGPEPTARIEPPAQPAHVAQRPSEPTPGPTDSALTRTEGPRIPLPAAPLTAPIEPPPTLRDQLRDGSPGPTMVQLDGGRFRMGHNTLSGGDTGPEHDVDVPPFLIGAYEVTFDQYDRFVRATGRRFPDDYGWGRGVRPVVGISWSDAEAYAEWLSNQTGHRYRLPSEAEWELAARGASRGSYPWGYGMQHGRAVCFDCGSQWDNRSTAPVGSFAPNAYGLYDVSGNAAEWVADCYVPGYEGAPTDGRPRLERSCSYRVSRGGAFNKPSKSMRVWSRFKLVPETRLNNLGFRLARDP